MKTFWLRDERRFPVAFAATEIVAGVMYLGLSVYNPRDEFDKHQGRMVAFGRLRKSLDVVTVSPFCDRVALTPGEVAMPKTVLMERLTSSVYPEQVRRAAKLWLKRIGG